MPSSSDTPEKDHTFISYARKDEALVDQLVSALRHQGVTTWVDRERIPASTKWMEQIRQAIVDAKACIFVISRHAIESAIWQDELREAENHGKRLIPVIIDDTPADLVPHALRELHWFPVDSTVALVGRAPELTETIRQDPDWVDAHTRLAIRTNEWLRSGKKSDRLLRGEPLRFARSWIEASP